MTPFDLPAAWSAEASCADAYLGFIDRVPQAAYFQTALEHLLPTISQSYSLADSSKVDFWVTRCFYAYIVYKLYTPHPITLNPFRSVLEASFVSPEVTRAIPGPSKIYNDALELILSDRGTELDAFRPRVALGRTLISDGIRPESLPPTSQSRLLEERDSASGLPDPRAQADIASVSEASSLRGATESDDDPERNLRGRLLSEAQIRVLSLSEQRRLLRALPNTSLDDLRIALHPATVAALSNLNGRIASAVMARILHIEESDCEAARLKNDYHIASFRNGELEAYIDALGSLPPIFSSFDVIGNLLRLERGLLNSGQLPIVRSVIVERFISNCLRKIDEYDREEQGTEVDDEGRTARTVRMVAKFAIAVLKSDSLELLEPVPGEASTSSVRLPSTTTLSFPTQPHTFSDGLDVELTNFALQHSRLVEANTLYSILASRFISQ